MTTDIESSQETRSELEGQMQLFAWPHGPWVYVMRRHAPGDWGFIYKIGISRTPAARAKRLNATIVACFPGDAQMEQALHAKFDRERFPGTEWFIPTKRFIDWLEYRRMAPWN